MSFDISAKSADGSVSNVSLVGDANDVSNGITIKTNEDDFPVYQQLALDHDNISFNFDSYRNTEGSYLSGYYPSQFQIEKANDRLAFNYSNNVSQGSVITWGTSLAINNSGGVSIGNGTAFNRFLTGTHTFGTSSSTGVVQTTIPFGQTLPSENYTVLLSPEVSGNNNEVFSVTPSAKSTTGCTVNIYRIDNTGGTWGNSLLINWSVYQ